MTTVRVNDEAIETCLEFLRDVLGAVTVRDFAVRFWNGSTWEAGSVAPYRFTLVLRHPGSLRRMFWPPGELTLAEAYINGDFDIEGDIEGVFSHVDALLAHRPGLAERLRTVWRLARLPAPSGRPKVDRSARLRGSRHSLRRDRQAVRHHYDLSNEFFTLFLDERMVYSCAYFASDSVGLDAAQEQKLDYICRKLCLRPGERLLDIGCGWGGLIRHAVRHYGVFADGITLSAEQAELARRRIEEEGLADRCRVLIRDYREVDRPGEYDKLVSVGMVEHVGAACLPEYFRRAGRLLRPGGVFLNQGIACAAPGYRPSEFIRRYVFPDGELTPISATLRAAEKAGFEVRDVESLREHYTLTLRHWVRRLEDRHEEACRLTDEVAYRIWRLYIAGSAHAFRIGLLNLYQALMVKPDRGHSGLPLTRDDWYT
jgi:cyclopropane-fatty-acyl-phospholipid synthase